MIVAGDLCSSRRKKNKGELVFGKREVCSLGDKVKFL